MSPLTGHRLGKHHTSQLLPETEKLKYCTGHSNQTTEQRVPHLQGAEAGSTSHLRSHLKSGQLLFRQAAGTRMGNIKQLHFPTHKQ